LFIITVYHYLDDINIIYHHNNNNKKKERRMSDVSSILGFEPNEFISELNKRIDTIIVDYVDRFKQEVKRLITNKGQNKVNIN